MTSWSSSEDEEETHLLNPLLIPHITKQICFYCSFEDLRNVRLVCKTWKQIGTEYFKPRCKLRFYNFRHMDTFMSISQEDFPLDLCSNVCLHGRDFQEWVILLKPFFFKFGSHIKSLDISHGIGDVTEEFILQIAQHIDSLEELCISGSTVLYSDRYIDGAGRFQFYPMLPSVKKLNLRLPMTCFKRWSDVRTFFSDFFSLFPNVNSIKFVGCQFPELFKYLPVEVQFPKLHTVHLQLINSEGLGQFIKRSFHLSKIILDVEPLLGLNSLHTFLEAFAHTLTHLDLSFHYKGPYNYSHNATGFPSSISLRKLQYLRLYGYWGNLYFLKDFVQLKNATVERMKLQIAFPEGTDKLELPFRKLLKFFDENGTYHAIS